ncbi:IS110 family transposase [Anaerovorax odorimutans]|uniref:IS110 family transposase n=1 Tax=Anaerovorax odorimutans TaxID=109327 RepID=A0ABT1RTG3_9FIRM|nr:IS110 family transposase [Anaerovorax odorimutans]MCQ4638490.1 IS110 family transposase [Anaerovorax odorimutans]
MDKLISIKRSGLSTVSDSLAGVVDITRFDNPKQLQKLARDAIVADSFGKHNRERCISHRGRERLRYVLYEAEVSLIGKNAEFKAIQIVSDTEGKYS